MDRVVGNRPRKHEREQGRHELQTRRRRKRRRRGRRILDVVIATAGSTATDGAALYPSEREKTLAGRFGGSFDDVSAAGVFAEHLAAVTTDHMIDCTARDRARIFNLGYYTWVEQQGTPFELFEARRDLQFWADLRRFVPVWDELITEFNARVAAG